MTDFSWWSPICLPNKLYCSDSEENLYDIFKSEREIGRYYPSEQMLELNKGLLLHYIFSGCDISISFRRILACWVREKFLCLDRLDRLRLGTIFSPEEL